MRSHTIRSILLGLALATTLQACKDGGSGTQAKGVGDSYLFVSIPNFYFGTQDVGTNVSQNIELINRGGDIYPIRSLVINGENSDEFSTELYDDITLNPSEAVSLRVSFSPITEGRKFAELDIDFDTIVQVTEAANQNEQNFYKAKELEDDKRYDESLNSYSRYLSGGAATVNKRRAAIKAPVIKESALYGTGEDFELYLSAVNLRESGDLDMAMAELDVLRIMHNDSYLADDALYLLGYIQLIDQKNYTGAQTTMKSLRNEHPDSTYYDTALFSEAIAHQELGNHDLARSILLDLKDRHTGVDTLGVTLPKDNVMSRLWFTRAEDALDQLASI